MKCENCGMTHRGSVQILRECDILKDMIVKPGDLLRAKRAYIQAYSVFPYVGAGRNIAITLNEEEIITVLDEKRYVESKEQAAGRVPPRTYIQALTSGGVRFVVLTDFEIFNTIAS